MAFPYLQDLVRAATGLNVPLPLPTFGLCVVVAVLAAIYVARLELLRLYRQGRLGEGLTKGLGKGRASEIPATLTNFLLDFAVLVVLSGFVGARIASILEVPRDFAIDPWGMIFSRQGFNFLGGLVLGVIAGVWYARRRGLPIRVACDAFAPALMLAYALGRVGCQLSGDGDWGIAANMALKPGWVPAWLWAQTYAHNIAGIVIAPPGVYPTPIYETLMCLALFAVLWAVRKHPFRSGWLFSLYLLLCGLERLAIEPIRINPRAHFLGIAATQAEILAATLAIVGAAGLVALSRRAAPIPAAQNAADPLPRQR
ncbi:MAG: prolipoprotein diacylglyceryl transferase family protein [Steroidobacteraceae bacterium]